jgi:RNA polymerase sigma-70 factor (ECF subfamily)
MSTNEAAASQVAIPLTPDLTSICSDARSTELAGLVRSHHPELVRHVYQYVRSWSDALDIVQQIYLNFLRTPGLSGVTNVRAYLFRAAGNLAIDWNRKTRVRDAYAREEPLRTPTLALSAEQTCQNRQDLEYLSRQIDALPPRCRTALLLVRGEGLSVEEAAKRLGIKPKSVRGHIARAMKCLGATRRS